MSVRNVVKLEERRSAPHVRVARSRSAAIELPMLEGAAITDIVCSACGEAHRLMYSVDRRDRWLCSVCDERSFVAQRTRRLRVRATITLVVLSVLAVLVYGLYRSMC